jgi:hypothetical protein
MLATEGQMTFITLEWQKVYIVHQSANSGGLVNKHDATYPAADTTPTHNVYRDQETP